MGVIETKPFCCIPNHTDKEALLRGVGRRVQLELASDTVSFFNDFVLTQRDSGMQSIHLKNLSKAVQVFQAVFTDHLQCSSHLAELQVELWEVTQGLEEFIVLLGSLGCKKKY